MVACGHPNLSDGMNGIDPRLLLDRRDPLTELLHRLVGWAANNTRNTMFFGFTERLSPRSRRQISIAFNFRPVVIGSAKFALQARRSRRAEAKRRPLLLGVEQGVVQPRATPGTPLRASLTGQSTRSEPPSMACPEVPVLDPVTQYAVINVDCC